MAGGSGFNPALTIIVPIYNVEKYIDECLRSIVAQTFRDYEVLMIDDGSTDGSSYICKRFSEDERFAYIYKENGGVSSARNLGLELSKGKYIGFVDPDDCISSDFYSSMIAKLESESADICQCEWLTTIDETGRVLLQGKSYRSRNDSLVVLEFGSVVWDKIYKKDIFHIARFDENLKLYEDVEIFSKILYHDIKMVFSDSGTYFYRVRDKSLSHRFYSMESYANVQRACESLQEYYNECKKDNAYKQENLEKIRSFEVNAKASMFIQNFMSVAGEHARKKTNKSILFEMLIRMQ